MWRNNKRRIILAAAITILLCIPISAQVAIPNESKINNQEKTSHSEQQNDVFDAKDVINYVEKQINSKDIPEQMKERLLQKLYSPITEGLINKQLAASNDITGWERFINKPETEKIMYDSCEDFFCAFTGNIQASVAVPSEAIIISGVFILVSSYIGGSFVGTGLNGQCTLECSSWMDVTLIIGGMLTAPALHIINIQNVAIIFGFGVYVSASGS